MATLSNHSSQHQTSPAPPSSATHFLDLGDNVFGLIHASLDKDREMSVGYAAKAARAFRHTCRALHRSPAINAQVCHTDLTLLYKRSYQDRVTYDDKRSSEDEDDDAEGSIQDELSEESNDDYADVGDVAHTWVCKIIAFPQHAVLRSLSISAERCLVLEMEYLEQLLLCILESPAAYARLKTVTDLEIQDAQLNLGCTTIILKLFPALMSGGKLALVGCTASEGFSCSLFSGLHHFSFIGDGCLALRGVGSEFEALKDIGMLSQLHSLSISCISPRDLDLCCLTQLRKLHTLCIHKSLISSLDTMLQSVPLQHLILDGMDSPFPFRLPSEISFASSTLRLLELNCLQMKDFQLSLHNLSSIQCVSITGIKLRGRGDELHRVRSAAVALSKFPLAVPATLVLSHQHGLSAEEQTAGILALHPLACLSLHVHELCLHWCILDRKVIQALHSLFGSVHSLQITTSDDPFRRGMLIDIVQGMPSVLCVSLKITDYKVPEPSWWAAELISVHQAGRDVKFKLIDASRGYWVCDTFQEVARAWQEAQRSLPGPTTVGLDITRVSMLGGLE